MPDPNETSTDLVDQAHAQDVAETVAPPVFREVGTTGLNRQGGVINEEYLRELAGLNGVRIFKEMSENDPIAAAMSFSLARLIARLPWHIQAPEEMSPVDTPAFEFVEGAFGDMDTPFVNVLDDILSMVPYGWSFLETNYKLRVGPEEALDWRRSQFRDFKIGWKNFRIRSQDTLQKWIYDDKGNMLGLEQLDPASGRSRSRRPSTSGRPRRRTTPRDDRSSAVRTGRGTSRSAWRSSRASASSEISPACRWSKWLRNTSRRTRAPISRRRAARWKTR